jgi:hypothetical protein
MEAVEVEPLDFIIGLVVYLVFYGMLVIFAITTVFNSKWLEYKPWYVFPLSFAVLVFLGIAIAANALLNF